MKAAAIRVLWVLLAVLAVTAELVATFEEKDTSTRSIWSGQ